MKYLFRFYLFFVLLCFSCQSVNSLTVKLSDDDVVLNFDKISIVDLVAVIYGDILKSNYSLHSDLVDFPKMVTVRFNVGFDKSLLHAYLIDLLDSVGVQIDKRKGYDFLRLKEILNSKDEEEIFFYKSKYRPVSFLMDLTSSLFKTGHFTNRRNVNQNLSPVSVLSVPVAPPVPVPVASHSPATHNQQQAVKDSGTFARSQIDKQDFDSFIFQGTRKEIDILQQLLIQIDTPIAEVFVKGIVYEVTTSSKEGSALFIALNLLQGQLGFSFGQVLTGANSFSLKSTGVDAVFTALSSDSRFRSVSNPSLRVKSGASARFSVGSDVPVIGASQFDKNGNVIQSVEYKPSGVIFDIKPIIRDNVIDLVISQQLSSFVPTTTGVNGSPTLIKREISTNIGSSDGDVIVLGGLDEDKSTSDNSGFSFLPSWSKATGDQITKTQILLILQVFRFS